MSASHRTLLDRMNDELSGFYQNLYSPPQWRDWTGVVLSTEGPADNWYSAYRARVEADHAAALEAKRLAQVAEINRHLGRTDEMGIEH